MTGCDQDNARHCLHPDHGLFFHTVLCVVRVRCIQQVCKSVLIFFSWHSTRATRIPDSYRESYDAVGVAGTSDTLFSVTADALLGIFPRPAYVSAIMGHVPYGVRAGKCR